MLPPLPRPLRVLHVVNDLRIGGAEVLVRNVAARLNAEGDVEAALTALQPNPTFLEESVRADGLSFEAHPSEWGFYSVRHVKRLAARMRGFDVVHVHLFPAQWWAALAWRSLPRRDRPVLVTTEHNTENRRRKPWFRPVDRWMYAHYHRLVGVSPLTGKRLEEWLGLPAGAVAVIPNGIDVDRFAQASAAPRSDLPGLPTAARLLLCVGRLEPQKDQATLLRALPLLPDDHHAALVGDGPLRGDLEALAASIGVAERVHFLGRRPDIPALLKTADVYVQPSRFEGWSLALLEAMASGAAPIVAADAPGLSEAVSGDRGWLFPVGDPEALAAAVRAATAEDAEATRRIAAGRQYADGFRLERCAEAHLSLYRELPGRTDSAR